MTLLAIDPGVALCAWAYFGDDKRLQMVDLAPPDTQLLPPGADRIVVEKPAYHGQRSANARVQDLINLAWSGAVFAGRCAAHGAVVAISPQAWKASMPKPVAHQKLWRVLSYAERELLGGEATARAISTAVEKGARARWGAGKTWYPKSFVTHNMLDAVAIGCVGLSRLTLKGAMK